MINITNQQLQNLIVTRDGELDQELTNINKTSPLQEVVGWTSLQTEMFFYDLIHRTNYRKTRNQLMRDKRNQEFEARLGLIRTKK